MPFIIFLNLYLWQCKIIQIGVLLILFHIESILERKLFFTKNFVHELEEHYILLHQTYVCFEISFMFSGFFKLNFIIKVSF